MGRQPALGSRPEVAGGVDEASRPGAYDDGGGQALQAVRLGHWPTARDEGIDRCVEQRRRCSGGRRGWGIGIRMKKEIGVEKRGRIYSF